MVRIAVQVFFLLKIAHLKESARTHPFNQNGVSSEIGKKTYYVDDFVIGCGSSIYLGNVETGFFLQPQRIIYGSGSGQPAVTATSETNSPDSLWTIKEAAGEQPCKTGRKIVCGERIRLEHITTGKNLHSEKVFISPLSHNQEVSLFGTEEVEDADDDWVIECVDESQDFVRGNTTFGLRHAESDKYLHTDRVHLYTNRNCRDCQIAGQQEVAAVKKWNSFCKWRIVGVTLM
eukprot:TRINITY_DN1273_c0_g1_i17.p1 TRINITY_DN1273_c0_g1~~TRINITY_DN1273_c0_g1_i17.p1  ORF type:complete len:232 (+),score=26.56 TRINITY_DN1273_c0_g1_i17:75-770(+)